ncbi:MAG: hypothetical protein V3W28_00430 [Thermoplasmata archaeon]
MEIKEITVSRSVRVNTGNYEGTEHLVRMRAEVDPTFDDLHEAHDALVRVVEYAMVEQLVRSYRVRGKKDMADPKRMARHHGLCGFDGD